MAKTKNATTSGAATKSGQTVRTSRTPSQASLDKIVAQLQHIENGSADGTVNLTRGVSLDVSHLAKIFFPDPQITKGEIMRYYTSLWPYLRPVLDDRPLSLKRFPDGVEGKSFFQQKAPAPGAIPAGVRVETITGAAGDEQRRMIGGSLITTLYCTQIGAFECNPWNVRSSSLEHPDFAVIDLDPGEKSPFSRVVEVALWVKEVLDQASIHAAVKTSGATGIHIVVPLPPGSSRATADRLPRVIAETVAAAHPRSATTVRNIRERGAAKIYVDFGQNSRGKTVAAAYGVRARAAATVSTPLAWDELTPALDPLDFTVRTIPARLARVGDLWAAAMKKPNPGRIVTTL